MRGRRTGEKVKAAVKAYQDSELSKKAVAAQHGISYCTLKSALRVARVRRTRKIEVTDFMWLLVSVYAAMIGKKTPRLSGR